MGEAKDAGVARRRGVEVRGQRSMANLSYVCAKMDLLDRKRIGSAHGDSRSRQTSHWINDVVDEEQPIRRVPVKPNNYPSVTIQQRIAEVYFS